MKSIENKVVIYIVFIEKQLRVEFNCYNDSTLDPFERNKVPKWFGRGQKFIKEEYFHETFVTAHCKIYLSLKKKYFVVGFFWRGSLLSQYLHISGKNMVLLWSLIMFVLVFMYFFFISVVYWCCFSISNMIF